MTKPNDEKRQLTIAELNSVSGGWPSMYTQLGFTRLNQMDVFIQAQAAQSSVLKKESDASNAIIHNM